MAIINEPFSRALLQRCFVCSYAFVVQYFSLNRIARHYQKSSLVAFFASLFLTNCNRLNFFMSFNFELRKSAKQPDPCSEFEITI